MGSGLSSSQKQLVKETPFEARELKKLRAVFAQVKGNKKDDELNREEFKEVFKLCAGELLGDTGDKKGVDLEEIFDSVDTDRSGTVSFKEMVLWLAIYLRGSEEDKLKHMFQAFDEDGSGTLEAQEINNVLEILKLSMTDRGISEKKSIKAAADLVKSLDRDKDGEITLEEWVIIGKQAHLVEELLGPQFIELMSHFSTN